MAKNRQTTKTGQVSKKNTSSLAAWTPVIVAIIGVIGTITAAIINNSQQPVPTIVLSAETNNLPITPTFTDSQSKCPEKMAYIPGSTFILGGVDTYAEKNEKPVREEIYLDPYCIDLTEVSNMDYLEYLTSAQIPHTNLYPNDKYPAVNVTWYEADKYCQYFGKSLPSEYQWEKAARGSKDDRIYPWGNDRDLSKANIENLQFIMSFVDAFESGRSPYGVLNMAGNAAEWTQDWYVENWYENIPKFGKNPVGPKSTESTTKVVRGGYMVQTLENARVSARLGTIKPDQSFDYLGFRCVSQPLR